MRGCQAEALGALLPAGRLAPCPACWVPAAWPRARREIASRRGRLEARNLIHQRKERKVPRTFPDVLLLSCGEHQPSREHP